MLQLENRSPFVPKMFVFPDPSGVDTLYVVIKATFEFEGNSVTVAKQQQPVVLVDEYWGEPGVSSLKYVSEAHLLKPATDVALVGSGHSPGGRAVPRFEASLSVGRLRKVINVRGERTWKNGVMGLQPSAPTAVSQVPITYERAYGGTHELAEGAFLSEPKNPVGRGFRGKKKPDDVEGQPLPNIELQGQPFEAFGDRPQPGSFGFIAPNWQPRASYAGTYDAAWQKSRCPYLPTDFDARFFSAVPPDQVYPGFLVGGEPVELGNLSPKGPQRFALPSCRLSAAVTIAGNKAPLDLKVETLLLEPDESRFCLAWRGAVSCDKTALKIEKVEIEVQSLNGVVA